jgi:hypothetical protein
MERMGARIPQVLGEGGGHGRDGLARAGGGGAGEREG